MGRKKCSSSLFEGSKLLNSLTPFFVLILVAVSLSKFKSSLSLCPLGNFVGFLS